MIRVLVAATVTAGLTVGIPLLADAGDGNPRTEAQGPGGVSTDRDGRSLDKAAIVLEEKTALHAVAAKQYAAAGKPSTTARAPRNRPCRSLSRRSAAKAGAGGTGVRRAPGDGR